MKKILKIILSIIYILGAIFEVLKLTINDVTSLLFFPISVFAFLMHVAFWIAPRKTFKFLRKFERFYEDDFSGVRSDSELESTGFWLLITAIVFLSLAIVCIIFNVG